MFKTETHLHVAEISMCSKIKAAEMIRLYYEAGYKTVFVSDHFTPKFTDSLGDIPWEDKITIFLSGYYKAREAGKKFDMNILMSAEISAAGSANHYLLYGITKEFLCKHPEICRKSMEEIYPVFKENGVFVVQAHPYRDGQAFPTPKCVDAFEVFNSNPRHEDFNEKAALCAKENGLYISAGSDAHRIEDVAGCGILSEKEIKCTEDFIAFIKSGKAEIFKG